MEWFDYSLIRYMPNPKRGEIVNLGLVIFNSTDIDIRMLKSLSKVQMLDGKTHKEDIEEFETALKEFSTLASSDGNKYEILSSLKSSIYLSERGQFAIAHPNDYEAKVEHLFTDLVEPLKVKPRQKETKGRRLSTILRSKFNELDVLTKDPKGLAEHKIVQDYVINTKSGLRADFIAKNGAYHLSEVIDFNVRENQSKIQETTLKVMTFLEGKKELGDVKCYFVYYADSEKRRDIKSQLSLAKEYSDYLVNMASKQDEKSYFDAMKKAVGLNGSFFDSKQK